MRQKLIDSIKTRAQIEISSKSPLTYLKELDPATYIDTVISTVYLFTRPKKGHGDTKIYLTELISAIGHKLRSQFKLKKDSALAAKTGAFILYSFERLSIIQVALGLGPRGHNSYIVIVRDDEAICSLWSGVKTNAVEKFPRLTPYAPWTTAYHPETGALLVKTNNKEVLSELKIETHPIIFDCVNKAQQIGWKINKAVYDIYTWALRNKTDAFADIWELQNPEAKATKLREVRAIGEIAKRFIGKTFYHLYYYDFRGRKYVASAYLHEQGTDLAKGLLLLDKGEPLGKDGFFWLMVSIASNWAGDAGREDGLKTDKIPLKDRFMWACDNEEIFLSYAESPKVNQGWMKADKPWQFLSMCIKLNELREWQIKKALNEFKEPHALFEDYSFVCDMVGFIDGSNNGSQHLSALTRDEVTAPHVNLVPQDLPGDLYKYVADHVWEEIDKKVNNMPDETIRMCEAFIDKVISLKKEIGECEQNSEARRQKIAEIMVLKQECKDIAELASNVFWSRIRESKHRRKIVKRNVMTLPYGGTAYGLGQQQIDDAKKHNIDVLMFMEHKWGASLGRDVFENCKVSLERPMRLLSVFEEAGRKAEERGEFLKWRAPVTNFPVVQAYTEGTVKKIWVQYGPPSGERTSTGYYENTYQLAVCFIEQMQMSKGKQSQGASPNAIHSLDAAHLAMVVNKADFPVITIHDSFGTLFSQMPKLFKIVREEFVRLYNQPVLEMLMKDIDGNINAVEIGTLDINLVLESEYCFV